MYAVATEAKQKEILFNTFDQCSKGCSWKLNINEQYFKKEEEELAMAEAVGIVYIYIYIYIYIRILGFISLLWYIGFRSYVERAFSENLPLLNRYLSRSQGGGRS